jgi:hypothetical protein
MIIYSEALKVKFLAKAGRKGAEGAERAEGAEGTEGKRGVREDRDMEVWGYGSGGVGK